MRSDLFTHEAQKTSAVFGRNTDLQVVFQGEQACTNGKTIYLPMIDQTADVSDDTAAVMRGYIDHEAGHVRHTNFRALNRFAKEATPLERGLQNAIEDVWLERQVRSEYPGAARNLRATVTAVNQEYLDQIAADDPRNADPRFIAAVAITWQGRRDYGGETCEQCLERLPDDLRAQVEGWVEQIDRCKGTSDTIKLAKRVAGEIEEAMAEAESQPESSEDASDEQPQESEDETSADERSGDDTDADDDTDPEPDTQPEADDEGEDEDEGAGARADADDGDDDEDEDDDGEPAESAQRGVGAEDLDPYSPDTAKAVEKLLENEGLTGSAAGYRPYSTAHDKWHHRTDEPGKYAGRFDGNEVDCTYGVYMAKRFDRHRYQQIVANMGSVVSGMRRKLERALLAKQKRDWDVGREHGRLDTKRLAGAVAGRSNVFKLRDDRAEMDTAVSVLVDMSGSMSGPKERLAAQAVIAIAEALERPGIPFEVLGFNNASDFVGVSSKRFREIHDDLKRGEHARYAPLDMYEFKRFDERLAQASGVLWQIERMADGGNSDGEAVLAAWRRLMARPESRKVMLVLSDGQPASPGDMLSQANYLGDVVRQVEASDGCDVVGIGIMDSSVEEFYGRHVVVYDIDELAGTAMDQLAKLLMGERFVVDNRKMGSSLVGNHVMPKNIKERAPATPSQAVETFARNY